MAASAHAPPARVNGGISPASPAEDEEFYSQILRLRDILIAGKHASIELPPAAIERLKSTLISSDAQARDSQQSLLGSAINGAAFSTNLTQAQDSSHQHIFPQSHDATRLAAAGLDPIFLEKSDSLVRAEGQLKRQRLDRALQDHVDQRKHSSRDRDPAVEAPSPIDIDIVLLAALEQVKPVSGLKETEADASTSFDENDYYSSQMQSDWSSESSSSKAASDKAAGAFTADFERLDGGPASSSFLRRASPPVVASSHPHVYTAAPEDAYEIADDDDEYTPPAATAFGAGMEEGNAMDTAQNTPPEDDNSDYEPGEITDSGVVAPQAPVEYSPNVPVIRNHLTHIVAPQPNRVSPLATAKGPTIELELVNGRPEVKKPTSHPNHTHSRLSSASPSGNGAGGSHKKKNRNKKRKREDAPVGRAKRRRDRQAAMLGNASAAYDEPYIKEEPISPPPFPNVPDVRNYGQAYVEQPSFQPFQPYYPAPAGSALRYENTLPSPSNYIEVSSPGPYRPVQRDTQDLRRVASLHVAQQQPSPRSQYSPIAPYRTLSMNMPNQSQQSPASPYRDTMPRYQEQRTDYRPYVRDERSRSPPRRQDDRESFIAPPQSPGVSMMPPPAPPPPRKIIVDQNGNRYYAAEPLPPTAPGLISRASAAPQLERARNEVVYERVPPGDPYGQGNVQYTYPDNRMPPPPPTRRQPERSTVDNYYAQPEPPRYIEAPTSPIYQPAPGYERLAPQYPVEPAYAPGRTYSARPEEPPQVLRHASVAPVQYVRRDVPVPAPAPARAVSVMPAAAPSEYGGSQLSSKVSQALQPLPPPRSASQAPVVMRYVDQYGNEVFPSQVRRVEEYRY